MLAEKELKALRGLLRAGVVRALWLGTPCTSFSRAREIPNWPNVLPIRSSEHPEGLPGLPPHLQLQVDVGNRLARSSAQIMELARQLGVPAATEGPSTSRMWALDCWTRLISRSGTRVAVTDYCQDGKPWRKRTHLVSVCMPLDNAVRHCCGRSSCSRTGKPHMQLQGTLNGIKLTLLAEPHPVHLCRRLATQFYNAMVGLKSCRC